MPESIVVKSPFQKAQAVRAVQALTLDEPVEVLIKELSGKRSLSANALQHVWYSHIAEFEQTDVRTAGNRCKLLFGLPLLLKDESAGPKVDWMLNKIGFYNMTYEQQLNVMDFIQVTSLFSTKQHNLYRDNIQAHYIDKGLYLEYSNAS